MRIRYLGLAVVCSLVFGAWIAANPAVAGPKMVVGGGSRAHISSGHDLAKGDNVLDTLGKIFGGPDVTRTRRSKSRHKSSPATGRIDATIKDNTNITMSGVIVTLTPKSGQNNGLQIVQVSNDDGQIRFLGLAPGRWTLTTARDEYSAATYDIRVRNGRKVTLAVRLDPEPYSKTLESKASKRRYSPEVAARIQQRAKAALADLRKKYTRGAKHRTPARASSKRTRARAAPKTAARSATRALNPAQRRAIKALRAEDIGTRELFRLARIAKTERRWEDFGIIMDELRRRNSRLIIHDAPPISVQDFANFIADFITPPDIGKVETVSTFGSRDQAEYEKLQHRTRVHRPTSRRIQRNRYPADNDPLPGGGGD